MTFVRNFIWLKRKRIDPFDGRPYLPDIYAATDRNLVIRASRQVEKSTFLCNLILYEAAVHPGIQILFVCPRREQALVFTKSRLLPALEQSPLYIRRQLLGSSYHRLTLTNMRFANESQLYVRAAYDSADAVRGLCSR